MVYKKFSFIIMLVFVTLFINISTFADDVKININGKEIYTSQSPVIENGRTLVPLRVIGEDLDCSVDWDSNTKTVTLNSGSNTISLIIGNEQINVNGKVIFIDSSPKIINGTTMVPVRAISELFGAKVDWDSAAKTVLISTAENSVNDNSDETIVNDDSEIITEKSPETTTEITTEKKVETTTELAVSKITLSNANVKIQKGDSLKLTAKIKPSNANTKIVWESSAPDIVSVTQEGKITALVDNAYAVITATASNGGVYDQCEVTVEKAGTKIILQNHIPEDYGDFRYDGTLSSKVSIKSVKWDIEPNKYRETSSATVYFSGTKEYDYRGPQQSSACSVGWKLYDKNNNVVDSGTMYSPAVSVGESFTKEIHIYDLEPTTYYLKLSNTN